MLRQYLCEKKINIIFVNGIRRHIQAFYRARPEGVESYTLKHFGGTQFLIS